MCVEFQRVHISNEVVSLDPNRPAVADDPRGKRAALHNETDARYNRCYRYSSIANIRLTLIENADVKMRFITRSAAHSKNRNPRNNAVPLVVHLFRLARADPVYIHVYGVYRKSSQLITLESQLQDR